MRILLLGKYGQLGWELRRSLATLGTVIALDYPEVDFTRPSDLPQVVLSARPDVLVNAVAYTAVDKAEEEADKAMAINGDAPGVLAEAARQIGAALIHYSTDFVFDGSKDLPYTEADAPNPLNAYGKSKLVGEQAVVQADGAYLILRTSWLYSTRQDNYVKKVLAWARQRPILRVVTDQTGSPTSARMLAEITAQMLAMAQDRLAEWLWERRGVYHLGGEGAATRYEWAEQILRLDPHREQQILQELQPAVSSEFPTPAVRPRYSALNCDKFEQTFGLRLPPWQEALQLTLEDSLG